MEPAANLFVTQWAPYPHYGILEVRIWQRVTPFGIFQRHEWRREDGTTQMDRWISSPAKRISVGMSRAAWDEPPPAESIEAALQMIADGHNDPRTLAREVLERIGYAP